MAKETLTKDHPVMEALKKLKDEEADLLQRLKPIQEAIGALEKIVEKSVKKPKPASLKEPEAEEVLQEAVAE